MLKKFISPAVLILALGWVKAYSQCYEINMSTCVGDFANGGDVESGDRLLGNTSGYGVGILQDNKVRIWISSGHTDSATGVSTPTTNGNIGVGYNGVSQIPLFKWDVMGTIRSTDSAYFTTSSGSVVIGSTIALPGIKFTNYGNQVSTGYMVVGGSLPVNSSTQTVWGSVTAIGAIVSSGQYSGITTSSVTYGDGTKQTTAFTGLGSTTGYISNLVVTTNSANTNQVIFTADAIDIQGALYVGFSTTCDLSILGAGGSDFAELGSRWYHFYAISNAAGTQAGIIASTGTTIASIVAPSWATKIRGPIFRIRNNASSNIVALQRRGRQYTYFTTQNIINTGSPASSLTEIDMASVVSSAAVSVNLNVLVGDTGGSVSVPCEIDLRAKGGLVGSSTVGDWVGMYMNNANEKQWVGHQILPLFGSRTLLYGLANSSVNTDQVIIDVTGWEEEIP